jgi:hypothetical protein
MVIGMLRDEPKQRCRHRAARRLHYDLARHGQRCAFGLDARQTSLEDGI